jgi:protein-S-isoprenylcysteine O-methyltransferase Ste14
MTRRIVILTVSAAGWCGFVAIIAWTMAFLGGLLPRTVDGPARTSTGWAVTVDLALLLLFAVQHSVMARRPAKTWLRRRVPAELERTTYVLTTNVCLALLLALWQPWEGLVWHVEGGAAYALWSLCAAGWVLAIGATFAIDHLELLGLRQAGWGARTTLSGDGPSVLQVGGLHAIVRHPLMTGMVLAFWATPRMSAPHLLFAVAATGYIAVGVTFEERDLRRTFGADYDAYAARVPALVPGLRLGLRLGRPAPPAAPSRRDPA